MVNASDNFKALAAAPGRHIYCQIQIGLRIYEDDRIFGFELRDIAHEDWFTIGTAYPNEFSFTVEHFEEHALQTEVRPFISFDGNEWLPLGVFFITRRYFRGRYAKLICYDKLYQLNDHPDNIPVSRWSRADLLLEAICRRADLTFSGTCQPFAAFEPSGLHSLRDIIGYIAALHCSCAKINRLGKLVFKPCSAASVGEISESSVFSENINLTRAGVRGLLADTGSGVIRAGSGKGLSMIEVYNPFMTQDIAESLISELSGIGFYGAELEMQGIPYLEAGEMMSFRGADGTLTPIMISEIRYTYDGGLTAKVFSRNKYNSDPVVHRQEFENALALLREEIGAASDA